MRNRTIYIYVFQRRFVFSHYTVQALFVLTSAPSLRAQQLKNRLHKILNGMDYSFRAVVVEAQKKAPPKGDFNSNKAPSPEK